MSQAKPFSISKKIMWEAYERVKANKGAAGVDAESIEAFAGSPPQEERDVTLGIYVHVLPLRLSSAGLEPVTPTGSIVRTSGYKIGRVTEP